MIGYRANWFSSFARSFGRRPEDSRKKSLRVRQKPLARINAPLRCDHQRHLVSRFGAYDSSRESDNSSVAASLYCSIPVRREPSIEVAGMFSKRFVAPCALETFALCRYSREDNECESCTVFLEGRRPLPVPPPRHGGDYFCG